MTDFPNDNRSHLPFSATAAAQKVAIATSVAALLMFGALIYNGSSNNAPRPAVAAAAEPITASDASAAPTVSAVDSDSDEDSAANADDSDTKARKAATDAVREAMPGSKVDGVFALSFARGTLYLCGVDTIGDGGKRQTINCLARLYVRKNGAQYWRAELFSDAEAAALLQKAERDDE